MQICVVYSKNFTNKNRKRFTVMSRTKQKKNVDLNTVHVFVLEIKENKE